MLNPVDPVWRNDNRIPEKIQKKLSTGLVV